MKIKSYDTRAWYASRKFIGYYSLLENLIKLALKISQSRRFFFHKTAIVSRIFCISVCFISLKRIICVHQLFSILLSHWRIIYLAETDDQKICKDNCHYTDSYCLRCETLIITISLIVNFISVPFSFSSQIVINVCVCVCLCLYSVRL